eukprot:3240175-Lingulodinium_polyedra.AAC.1
MPGDRPILLAAWCRSRAAEVPPTGISCLICPTATNGSSAYCLPRTLMGVLAATRLAMLAAQLAATRSRIPG